MSAVRKFSFDTVFAPDGAVLRDGSGFRAQFTADEVEAAKANAFEEGRTHATARAHETAAGALQRLANDMRALLDQVEAERATLREEAAALALAAARAAAGAALDAFGNERIVAAIEQAMDQLRHGPRVIVRVPTESYTELRARLEDLAQTSAYPGALVIREDAGLLSGEVSLEWAEGLIALSRDEVFTRIEDIIARSLSGAPQTEETGP